MRLSREDVAPLSAIITAGWIGILATSVGLRALAPFDSARSELQLEYELPSQESWQFIFDVPPSTYSFTIYGDLIEEIEALQARQREVSQRVSDLAGLGPADRSQEIAALRTIKVDMMGGISGFEARLDRAARDAPSLGFNALATAAGFIRDSSLKEKVRYSQGTIEQWDAQSAVALEQDIEDDLRTLREQFTSDWARGVLSEFDPSFPRRR